MNTEEEIEILTFDEEELPKGEKYSAAKIEKTEEKEEKFAARKTEIAAEEIPEVEIPEIPQIERDMVVIAPTREKVEEPIEKKEEQTSVEPVVPETEEKTVEEVQEEMPVEKTKEIQEEKESEREEEYEPVTFADDEEEDKEDNKITIDKNKELRKITFYNVILTIMLILALLALGYVIYKNFIM